MDIMNIVGNLTPGHNPRAVVAKLKKYTHKTTGRGRVRRVAATGPGDGKFRGRDVFDFAKSLRSEGASGRPYKTLHVTPPASYSGLGHRSEPCFPPSETPR